MPECRKPAVERLRQSGDWTGRQAGISRRGIYSCSWSGQARHGGVSCCPMAASGRRSTSSPSATQLTPSGLARRAGLDPTTFNRSKRVGRRRPPALALDREHRQDPRGDRHATRRLSRLLGDERSRGRDECRSARCRFSALPRPAPAASSTMAAFPPARAGTRSTFPGTIGDGVFALEVTGDSMLPLYRDGDTIIVSPATRLPARRPGGGQDQRGRGDGEDPAAQDRARRSSSLSLNPGSSRTGRLPSAEIEWMARIIWASQ